MFSCWHALKSTGYSGECRRKWRTWCQRKTATHTQIYREYPWAMCSSNCRSRASIKCAAQVTALHFTPDIITDCADQDSSSKRRGEGLGGRGGLIVGVALCSQESHVSRLSFWHQSHYNTSQTFCMLCRVITCDLQFSDDESRTFGREIRLKMLGCLPFPWYLFLFYFKLGHQGKF